MEQLGEFKSITSYSDLLKEYMKNIDSKDYLNNIDYNIPITTIEPLKPIYINEINQLQPLYKEYKEKINEITSQSYIPDLVKEKELQKEIERKKRLDYQNFLDQQIEEKKIRKRKEKEEQMKEDLMYEKKFREEKNQMEINNNKKKGINIESTKSNNMKEITDELFKDHPALNKIANNNQLIMNQIEEPLSLPNQYQNQYQQQQEQEMIPQSFQMQSNPQYIYSHNYNIPTTTRTNMSTPNLNIHNLPPFNPHTNSNLQLNASNNNMMIPQIRDYLSINPINSSSNNLQGMIGMKQNNYPPILEKMLDYFFQEQVKIMKDDKDTIKHLKNEIDQAYYINKAHEERIQALERLKNNQEKISQNFDFSPSDKNHNPNLEDTLSSIIAKKNKEISLCQFKSKYEEENDYTQMNMSLDKSSIIGETKFIKQLGEGENLLETWIMENDNDKERIILHANDISSITQRNLCDDKSFNQLNEMNSFDDKSIFDPNEQICYPKFFRGEDEYDDDNKDNNDKEIVKEYSGKIMINKDNNFKYENSLQKLIDINNVDNSYCERRKNDESNHNDISKVYMKETRRYNDESQIENNKEDKSNIDLQFHIETGENNNVDLDNNKNIQKNTTQLNDNHHFSDNDSINITHPHNNNSQIQNNNVTQNIDNNIQVSNIINNDKNLPITKPIQSQPKNDTYTQSRYNENFSLKTNSKQTNTLNNHDNISIIIKNIAKQSTYNNNNQSNYHTETNEPILSDINPINISHSFSQKSIIPSQDGNINTRNKQDHFHKQMTFFEDSNSQIEDDNLFKSSKHVIGNGNVNVYSNKPISQVRVPRDVSQKNINHLNNFYEKMKKRKIDKKPERENSKADDSSLLLNESLNTFNANLKVDNTFNDQMMKKVEKYTKVALNQIDQSQLTVFQKKYHNEQES